MGKDRHRPIALASCGGGPPISPFEPTSVANPRIWALPPVAKEQSFVAAIVESSCDRSTTYVLYVWEARILAEAAVEGARGARVEAAPIALVRELSDHLPCFHARA